MRQAVTAAQAAVAEAEAATLRAEAAQSGARQALDVARQPLTEAERRVNRLETEAKTLAKVLQVDVKNLWPPVIDLLTVEKGFETALGAALGDDLDAPIEPTRADPLGRRRARSVRSGAAGGRRAARRPCHASARPSSPAASPRSASSPAPTARGWPSS